MLRDPGSSPPRLREMSLTDAQRQAGEIFVRQWRGLSLEAGVRDPRRVIASFPKAGKWQHYVEFRRAEKAIQPGDKEVLCAVTIMDMGVRAYWKRYGEGLPEREIRRRLIRALDALVIHYGLGGDF